MSGPASESETLRGFLNAGSVSCPSCGYDVHGCDEAKCPECAWPLSLQLKPRANFVPYWIFSLLINGWLFIWGLGGTVSTWLRAWQFHGMVSRQLATAAANLQSQATIPALTDRGANAATASPISSAPVTLAGNLWTFFLGQNLRDQVAIPLFLTSLTVGAAGLLLTPWMRRCSPRANAWVIAGSIAIFLATMLNYVVTYVSYLFRAF